MKLTLTLLVVWLLSACTQTVNTKVTAFNVLTAPAEGSVTIQASPQELNQTLEFQYYKDIAAKVLAQHNLVMPESNQAESDYLVTLGFSVQEVSPEGSPVNSAVVLRGSPWRTVGSDVVLMNDHDRTREYKRTLVFTLTERTGQRRVYEATATSIGSCDVMTVVFDEMLQAILALYPQQSGSVQKIKIKGDSRC